MKKRALGHHGTRVDLAHVLTGVFGLDPGDDQVELGLEVAGDGHATVLGDDLIVQHEDRLRVRLDPTDLKGESEMRRKREIYSLRIKEKKCRRGRTKKGARKRLKAKSDDRLNQRPIFFVSGRKKSESKGYNERLLMRP